MPWRFIGHQEYTIRLCLVSEVNTWTPSQYRFALFDFTTPAEYPASITSGDTLRTKDIPIPSLHAAHRTDLKDIQATTSLHNGNCISLQTGPSATRIGSDFHHVSTMDFSAMPYFGYSVWRHGEVFYHNRQGILQKHPGATGLFSVRDFWSGVKSFMNRASWAEIDAATRFWWQRRFRQISTCRTQ